LLVDRYAVSAKIVFLSSDRKPLVGRFDPIRFERLLRSDNALWSLILKHTEMGNMDPVEGERREWLHVGWVIVQNELGAVPVVVRSLGVSVEVDAGTVEAALIPDDQDFISVEVPFAVEPVSISWLIPGDRGLISVEVPSAVEPVSISWDIFKAGDLPRPWAYMYPPPPGFTRVYVMTVRSRERYPDAAADRVPHRDTSPGVPGAGRTRQVRSDQSPAAGSVAVIVVGIALLMYVAAWWWLYRLHRWR